MEQQSLVKQLIAQVGGPEAIAAMSRTLHPDDPSEHIKAYSVYSWHRKTSGIPESRWHIMQALDESITLETLHEANTQARERKRQVDEAAA